jgi:signal transduction histidine kinase/DNA-binding response OmpR family regulator
MLLAVMALGLVGYQLLAGDSIALHLSMWGLIVAILLLSIKLSWRRPAPSTVVERPAPAPTAPSGQIAQLVRDKEAAEAANAAKSRYLANVSHEIRSPLNAIYGYAQLVERDAGMDPQEAARVIRRSAEHLTNLVEGLLDISQVENGVMRVNNDVVRLPTFIDQTVSMFRPSATMKGLEFRCELPERLPEFVRTDQKRLRQVLINLISNAIKFTERGTVTLKVSYSGQVAVFEVCDTGPGISADDRERIFAPFERASVEGARPQSGVGLGLPITCALVQILGGNLELESEPGQGTTFRVTLMLGHVAGYLETAAPMRHVVGYQGPRKSILVVDDEVEQLAFMRHLLEGLGFEVALAPDGDTALAFSHANNFDLAVLDLSMPGLSGWDTAAHLRATHGSGLRIIMLSGNAHERHGVDGQPHVHDLFLVKPIEIGALVDAIGAQLELTWNYDSRVTGEAPVAVSTDQPLSEAARGHVEKLRELLRIGHVRGIEAEIRELEAAAPEAHGLIATLYDCLDRFDLAALAKTLEGL